MKFGKLLGLIEELLTLKAQLARIEGKIDLLLPAQEAADRLRDVTAKIAANDQTIKDVQKP